VRRGPVFYRHRQTGDLQMRYTARPRHIVWKQTPEITAARQYLSDLLAGASPYIVRHRLQAGQGIICNNVLHSRAAYRDDAAGTQCRRVLRARYYERVRHEIPHRSH
jgi:hypothetical protein